MRAAPPRLCKSPRPRIEHAQPYYVMSRRVSRHKQRLDPLLRSQLSKGETRNSSLSPRAQQSAWLTAQPSDANSQQTHVDPNDRAVLDGSGSDWIKLQVSYPPGTLNSEEPALSSSRTAPLSHPPRDSWAIPAQRHPLSGGSLPDKRRRYVQAAPVADGDEGASCWLRPPPAPPVCRNIAKPMHRARHGCARRKHRPGVNAPLGDVTNCLVRCMCVNGTAFYFGTQVP